MEFYSASIVAASSDFKIQSQQADAISRLKKRERHYKLLGEPAPEISATDNWIPGRAENTGRTEGQGRAASIFGRPGAGRSIGVLSVPQGMQQDHVRHEGLVILGLTRLYGNVEGTPA
jgi:hypothetical protein